MKRMFHFLKNFVLGYAFEIPTTEREKILFDKTDTKLKVMDKKYVIQFIFWVDVKKMSG